MKILDLISEMTTAHKLFEAKQPSDIRDFTEFNVDMMLGYTDAWLGELYTSLDTDYINGYNICKKQDKYFGFGKIANEYENKEISGWIEKYNVEDPSHPIPHRIVIKLGDMKAHDPEFADVDYLEKTLTAEVTIYDADKNIVFQDDLMTVNDIDLLLSDKKGFTFNTLDIDIKGNKETLSNPLRTFLDEYKAQF